MIDSVSNEGAGAADLKRAKRVRRPQAAASTVDRLPPHSPEAEQGVLGCALLAPNECMGECIEKFKNGSEVFYDLRHQTIFSALAEMYDARIAIDVITLQQRLKDKQLLEQVGGIAYLSSLPDAVPSAANLSYYLEIVKEKYLLRRMIHTCTDVVSKVYDFEGEVDALMDEVERDVLRISEARVQEHSSNIKDLVKRAINQIEDFHQRQGMLTGVGTAIGLGTAAALMHLMRTLLFGISPLDPITFTAVPVVLVATAALASYLPARRTTAVNPVEAVRAE